MSYLDLVKAKLKPKEPPKFAEREMTKLYLEARERINEVWKAGTYDVLERDHASIMAQINEAEAALENTWRAVRVNKASLDEFKTALAVWEKLHYVDLSVDFQSKQEELGL